LKQESKSKTTDTSPAQSQNTLIPDLLLLVSRQLRPLLLVFTSIREDKTQSFSNYLSNTQSTSVTKTFQVLTQNLTPKNYNE